MSGLKGFLENLSLAVYAPIFAEKGYDDVSQLTCLNTVQLDQVFNSIGMLKGHSLKLRKSVETIKSTEPIPVKKPKVTEVQSSPPRPEAKSAFTAAKTVSPSLPQPGTIKVKEAERLAAKLADTESIREDYRRAKDLILAIDIGKYRKVLEDVVAVQDALAKVWGVEGVLEEEGRDAQGFR